MDVDIFLIRRLQTHLQILRERFIMTPMITVIIMSFRHRCGRFVKSECVHVTLINWAEFAQSK